MEQTARFYGSFADGKTREVPWPLQRHVEVLEPIPSEAVPSLTYVDAIFEEAADSMSSTRYHKYKLQDYAVKLPNQEERYVRVYVHISMWAENPELAKRVARDFGWPDEEVVPFGASKVQ